MVSNIKAAIREHVVATWLNGHGRSFTDDTDLLKSGIIDSVSVAELWGYLETTFSVELAWGEIGPDDFRTVNTLSSMVEKVVHANGVG